jgi:biotin carboxyl carrier protein
MNLTRVLTIAFTAISLYLAYFLYNSIQSVIDTREKIDQTEKMIIERLKLIREAEVVFQEQNGRYTASWDTLVAFIQNGQVPILQRREIITQKPYGGEEVRIEVDTLGFLSAKERIFKKNYTLGASDNGVFVAYKVKVGDQVLKNQKAYAIQVGDRTNEPPFQEKGVIASLADVKSGDPITRGKILINYYDYIFNPNTDLSTLAFVPGSEGVKFEIFAGTVDKNGIKVDVIEVKDPKPVNPERKESNEQKARKPLRFGSRLDVSTAGNWE